VLHKAISEYQDITLLDTKRFGKVNNSSSSFSSHKAEQKETKFEIMNLFFLLIVVVLRKNNTETSDISL